MTTTVILGTPRRRVLLATDESVLEERDCIIICTDETPPMVLRALYVNGRCKRQDVVHYTNGRTLESLRPVLRANVDRMTTWDSSHGLGSGGEVRRGRRSILTGSLDEFEADNEIGQDMA